MNWTEPVATDNSGVAPTVTSNYQSPQRFIQGTHVIIYTAVDQSGNNATCKFHVQVLGNEDFARKISLQNTLCNFCTFQILFVKKYQDKFIHDFIQKTVLFIVPYTTMTIFVLLKKGFYEIPTLLILSVINCTLLVIDSGGPLRISTCGTHYGSKCNFSCAIGYRLNGSSTVTCVAPGNRPRAFWDNPVPSCQGRFTKGYIFF